MDKDGLVRNTIVEVVITTTRVIIIHRDEEAVVQTISTPQCLPEMRCNLSSSHRNGRKHLPRATIRHLPLTITNITVTVTHSTCQGKVQGHPTIINISTNQDHSQGTSRVHRCIIMIHDRIDQGLVNKPNHIKAANSNTIATTWQRTEDHNNLNLKLKLLCSSNISSHSKS